VTKTDKNSLSIEQTLSVSCCSEFSGQHQLERNSAGTPYIANRAGVTIDRCEKTSPSRWMTYVRFSSSSSFNHLQALIYDRQLLFSQKPLNDLCQFFGK